MKRRSRIDVHRPTIRNGSHGQYDPTSIHAYSKTPGERCGTNRLYHLRAWSSRTSTARARKSRRAFDKGARTTQRAGSRTTARDAIASRFVGPLQSESRSIPSVHEYDRTPTMPRVSSAYAAKNATAPRTRPVSPSARTQIQTAAVNKNVNGTSVIPCDVYLMK